MCGVKISDVMFAGHLMCLAPVVSSESVPEEMLYDGFRCYKPAANNNKECQSIRARD